MSHPEPVSPMMTTTLFLATASTIWSSYWLIGRSLRASMLWALGLCLQIQCARDMLHMDTCKICKTESHAFMNRTPQYPGKYISIWPCHFQRCKYAFQMDITISRTQFQRNCIYMAVLLYSKRCLRSLPWILSESIKLLFLQIGDTYRKSRAIQHQTLASITPSRKF